MPSAAAAHSVPDYLRKTPVSTDSLPDQPKDYLPLMAVENRGQFGPDVLFKVEGLPDAVAWLSANAITFSLVASDPGAAETVGSTSAQATEPAVRVIALRFAGANPNVRVQPFDPLAARFNYYTSSDPANWVEGAPVFAGVRYIGLYPGLDLELTASLSGLRSRLIVTDPSGDAAAVFQQFRISAEGADSVFVSGGRLVMQQADSSFSIPLFFATTEAGATLALDQPATAEHPITDTPVAGDAYLTLAPEAAQAATVGSLLYGTYIGGGGVEYAGYTAYGYGDPFAIDANGNMYVAGRTASGSGWPPPKGGYDYQVQSGDGFIVKIDPGKTTWDSLVYATFVGGSGDDAVYSVKADAAGNTYFVAGTNSCGELPTLNGFDLVCAGNTTNWRELFAAKLGPSGTLSYSTYIGGSGIEMLGYSNNGTGDPFAIDAAGNMYLGGYTTSADGLGGILKNAFDSGYQGTGEGFLIKIDPTKAGNNSLIYATYVGVTGPDAVLSVKADASGNAYFVAGFSQCRQSEIQTPNGYKIVCDTTGTTAWSELYAAKLGPNGGAVPLYSTYVGGSGRDHLGYASTDAGAGDPFAIDASGNMYIGGATASGNGWSLTGAFDQIAAGWEGFLVKVDTTKTLGPSLKYATFVGGNSTDAVLSVKADDAGNTYFVAGVMSCAGLPQPVNGYDTTCASNTTSYTWYELYAGKIGPDGATSGVPLYTTYIGGASIERLGGGYHYSYACDAGTCYASSAQGRGDALAIDGQGRMYVGGYVSAGSPLLLKNAFDSSIQSNEAYVIVLDPARIGYDSLVYATYAGGNGADAIYSLKADNSGNVYALGAVRGATCVGYPFYFGFDGTCAGSNTAYWKELYAFKLLGDVHFPGPFSKSDPISGTTNIDPMNAALSWSETATNTLSYQHCADNVLDGRCNGVWKPGLGGQDTYSGLSGNTWYEWQARAMTDTYGLKLYTYADSTPGSGGDDGAGTTWWRFRTGNRNPVAVEDSVNARMGSGPLLLFVLSNDWDPDGDTIRVSSIGPVSSDPPGAITVTNVFDRILVDFAPAWFGKAQFVYVITDTNGGMSAAAVRLTVNAVNLPPDAIDDTASTVNTARTIIDVLANDIDPNGDALSIVGLGQPFFGGVTALTTTSGLQRVVFSPTIGFSGTSMFSYTVSDGVYQDTAYVSVLVRPSNRAPDAVDDVATTQRNTAVTIYPLTNDTDPDGDAISIVAVGNVTPAGAGALLWSGSQVFFDPAETLTGTAYFTYTISDGLLRDTAWIRINVIEPNRPPEPMPDVTSAALNGGYVVIDVLQNDTDPDGNLLSLVRLGPITPTLTGMSHQLMNMPSSSGVKQVVRFDYPNGYSGTAVFTYTVSDLLITADTTVMVNIQPVQPPVAVDDVATAITTTAIYIDVLANDFAPSGNTLVINGLGVVSPTDKALVGIVGDRIRFQATAGFVGTASFTYTIRDQIGNTAWAWVYVSVTSTNRAPVAINDFRSVMRQPSQVVLVDALANDFDPDGNVIRLAAVAIISPAGALASTWVDGNGKEWVAFFPDDDFAGTASISYTISDGYLTGRGVVYVEVRATNQPPVALDDAAATPSGVPVIVDALANDHDPDGDTLRIVAAGVLGPAGAGQVEVTPDQRVRFAPQPGFTGVVTIAYAVSDGQQTATALIRVQVSSVVANRAPIAVDDVAAAPRAAVSIDVLANDSDPDGDALSVVGVALVGPANAGAAGVAGNRVVFNPSATFTGWVTLVYTISDGLLNASAQIRVWVHSANAAPIALNDAASTQKGVSLVLNVMQNDWDPDGDSVQLYDVGAVNAGVGTVAALPDGRIRFSPVADFIGTAMFTYTISDGRLQSTATVRVQVYDDPNQPPVAVGDVAATPVNVPILIDVLANDSDPEGNTLTIVAVGQPGAGGLAGVVGDRVRFAPATGFIGTVVFSYTISDGALQDTALVTVVVHSVNAPPVAVGDTISTPQNTLVQIDALANDYDPDGDALAIVAIGQTSSGATGVSGGQVTFMPNAGFSGTVVFSYTISDGALQATGSITVNVHVVNTAPVAVNDTAATRVNRAVRVDVLANDYDPNGDAIYITSIGATTSGAATLSDGQVLFIPYQDVFGQAVFTYTLSDGKLSATGRVTVTISQSPFDNLINDETLKFIDPATVAVGSVATYTLAISNSGASAVVVRITDTIDSQVSIVSVTPATTTQIGPTLVWSVTVGARALANITIRVRALPGNTPYDVPNSFVLGVFDVTEWRETEIVSSNRLRVTGQADAFEGSSKVVTPTAARSGELVTFTLILSNSYETAATVRVTDTLDSRLAWQSGGSHAAGVVTWLVNVPGNTTLPLDLVARPSAAITQWVTLTNTYVAAMEDGSSLARSVTVNVSPTGTPVIPRVYLPLARR